MSRINQIQQALLAMGPGKFQKLADAYLKERGHDRLNPIGSVTGADKVKKGTPDTLVAQSNGNYIFVEHTTQQSGVQDKLLEDLEKCFDTDKTGVPIEKIERVIFCFTSKLDTVQENELAQICQQNGVGLELFGIDAISFDLYQKYPGLARDFLGVQVDTGQIVRPDQFVTLYNRNKLATRLDLTFHFREEELDDVLSALEREDLVILSGRAGIGKSRLALEAIRRFQEVSSDYTASCIFMRGRDLWDDLRVRFSKPGSFLILVDDANRVSRFEYIVDLLVHQKEGQQIKVIATVRDYALAKVQEAALPTGGGVVVEVQSFTDEQIKTVVENEFGIRNNLFLERIADIASGNPRLAVMAAEVAKKEDTLRSIYDVTDLYDRYFSSIRKHLREEGVETGIVDLMKVAGIVFFFKAIDRANEEMMEAIEEAFDITPDVFWEATQRLHEMELLNIYEDEVVRAADQVLAMYLFYLAVFKEKVLDFGAFLDHFFPQFRSRMMHSISPVLNAFDTGRIIELMQPHIERAWAKLEKAGDEQGLLLLAGAFWFVDRTRTLSWARDRISKLEADPVDVVDLEFEGGFGAEPSPSVLKVLGFFANTEVGEARIALNLIMSYLATKPGEVQDVLQTLMEVYGFKHTSYMSGFEIQRAVVDVVWEWRERDSALFARVFLSVAKKYLGTRFESTSMKDDNSLEFLRFDLPATAELRTLREKIWQRLFTLNDSADFLDDVLRLIHRYSTSSPWVNNSEVIKQDADHLLPFLEAALDPDDYGHCRILHAYLDLLERHDIELQEELRELFSNDTYRLSKILLSEWGDRDEPDLSYNKYRQYRRDRLAEYTAGYGLEEYVSFFERCLEIRQSLNGRQNSYQLKQGVVVVLLSLAEEQGTLYVRVLKHYLTLGDPLGLPGYHLVQKLVEQRGIDEAMQFLSNPDYPTKRRWLFYLHEVLPDEAASEERLAHLYSLYEAAKVADLPYDWVFLLKYVRLDKRVVARVVSIILDRVGDEPDYVVAFESLFNLSPEITKQIADLFRDDLDILRRAYLAAETTQHQVDYKGAVFNLLLDLDPDFISEYIDWRYESTDEEWLRRQTDHRDYSFVWVRQDYEQVMEKAVDRICAQEQKRIPFWTTYLEVFFGSLKEDGLSPELLERKTAFLLRLIDRRHENKEFMSFLFDLIAELSPGRRPLFVERFVQHNKSFEDFRSLRLEPISWSAWGSLVPMLQGRLDFWESLIPIMKSVELLEHRQFVGRQIQGLRNQIEQEKRRDFIRD